MITHFRLMFPSMEDGIDGLADYDRDVLVLKLPNGLTEFSLSHARGVLDKPFHVPEPKEGWRRDFSDREKAKLRPIAETLAMLDGNALFGNRIDETREWYEGYLSLAHAVYEANGGDSGWAGAASFAMPCTETEPAPNPGKAT